MDGGGFIHLDISADSRGLMSTGHRSLAQQMGRLRFIELGAGVSMGVWAVWRGL